MPFYMHSFISSRHRAVIALVASAIATTDCTQVQQFGRDGAVPDATANDVVDDFPPAICAANGFVSGPVEVSTGTVNGGPLISRSGPDLVVAWTSGAPDSVNVRFLDPVTLAPRAGVVVAHPETGGATLGDLSLAATGNGAAVAFTRDDGTNSEPRVALVGRDGIVTERTIALGAATTGTDRALSIAFTGRGYGLAIRTRTALWLARLGTDGQLVAGDALTHVADRSVADVETGALAWDPIASRFVIAYPRTDSGSLVTARVTEVGVVEASETTVIAADVTPTHHPDLAWSGSGFGVLSCLAVATGGCEPSFRSLAADGSASGDVQRLGGNANGNARDSAIVFGADSYAAIWSGLPGSGELHNTNIHVATLDVNGNVRTAAAPLPIDADNALDPDIVWDGNAFAATWGGFDVPTEVRRIFVARLCAP